MKTKKKERKKYIRNSPFRLHRKLSPKTKAVPTTESHDRSVPKREDEAKKEKKESRMVSIGTKSKLKTKTKRKGIFLYLYQLSYISRHSLFLFKLRVFLLPVVF